MSMSDEFHDYLVECIGMKRPLLELSNRIHRFFEQKCPEEITDIFVSERTKEGERTYESLWFFSKKYMMEAKQFISKKDDFDITPIKNRVKYWRIVKEQYNYRKATRNSRLFLQVSLNIRVAGEMRASAKNCDHLRGIIEKHVMPNLIE